METMVTANPLWRAPRLLAQAEKLAASQGRTADDLAADALKRYLAHESLNKIEREGQERRRQLGLKSDEEVEAVSGSRHFGISKRAARPPVTLDSSAYISALQFNGRAAHLLRMAADDDLETAISSPIITEVIGVFRERFGWDGYRLHAESPFRTRSPGTPAPGTRG